MKNHIFLLSTILFLSFEMTSCQIKKETIKSNQANDEKIEQVQLDFEILTEEISLEEIKKIDDFRKKLTAYNNFEILATLKQTNKTTEKITLDNFIVYENYEITNIKKERKDDLIHFYDYSIVFDPETYLTEVIEKIMPNEYSIDTLNLVNDFKFYSSNPDTLLIRMKKQYFEKTIYSNWDTLIIK